MEKKFFFDANIFDSPAEEASQENLPPPPPTFSEDDITIAKDLALEQGRQQGRREEKETREQFVASSLASIAEGLSHLFAAETVRENIFEKEALKLALHSLDLLFPLLNAKIGHDEVRTVIAKALADHRKTKEILITVPPGLKGEIDALLSRLREGETDEVHWRVQEDASLSSGDCRLEWSDGGAVRNSVKTAQDIRRQFQALLKETHEITVAEDSHGLSVSGDVSYEKSSESETDAKAETGA